jgi:nickel-type superoxide dismutase maturation protease
MEPTLHHGDWVLVAPRAYDGACPKPGDVVVAHHPHQDGVVLLKRVARAGEAGVFLVGDSPDGSTDSRDFGVVAPSAVLGRVECVIT